MQYVKYEWIYIDVISWYVIKRKPTVIHKIKYFFKDLILLIINFKTGEVQGHPYD